MLDRSVRGAAVGVDLCHIAIEQLNCINKNVASVPIGELITLLSLVIIC